MRFGRLALIAVALLLASGTAFMAKNWIEAERSSLRKAAATTAPATNQRILVAKTRLATGQFISADNVHWISWPEGSMSSAYIV